jgi:hydrogenase maturation protease
MAPFLVLGLGNVLIGDEGFGVYVAQHLAKNYFFEDTEIVEGATSGISLAWEIENRKRIIVIDAIKSNKKPGTLFRFNHSDVKNYYVEKALSMHQVDFISALKYAEFLNIELPEITFFAVQPEDLSLGMRLSETLGNKIFEVADLVKTELCCAKAETK